MTSITNPWKLAGINKRAAPQTTPKQKLGTLTKNLKETIKHILQALSPQDNQEDDTELQENFRALAREDVDPDEDT